jgi:hypothetical protein
MTATVYVDAINQKGLIAENVKILKLSEAPRYTKKGVMFVQPFAGCSILTDAQRAILRLWRRGVRRADVIYPDGTHDINVWVNIKDIQS